MKGRQILRILWRYSLWLTVPIALIFLALASEVVPRYQTFGVDHMIQGRRETKLLEFMEIEAQRLIGRTRLAFKPAARDRPLRQIHLYVDPGQQALLDSDLPHSGRQYVEGRLRYPDQRLEDIKVRYRGDFWWHWVFHKKSMRLKTSKRQLFDGMRAINLVAPKFPALANNHLAYRLADSFGLLTPHSEMVNVWLNDRIHGVYLLVEQPSELTLSRHGRMPGDLVRGEMVARDSYTGIHNSLFRHPRIWQHIARGPGSAEAPHVMERFVESLNRELSSTDLTELFDPQVWGRFFAFEILAQTDHFDNLHNWRLYYDPWRGKFEPLIWDANGWHPRVKPKRGELWQFDFRASHLHDVLLSDSRFLLARQAALEDFFERKLDEEFFAEVDSVLTAVEQEVRDDPNLVTSFRYWTPQQVSERTQVMRRDIVQLFQQVRKEYVFNPFEILWQDLGDGKLRVQIAGRRGVPTLRVRFDKNLAASAARVTSGEGSGIRRVERDGSTEIYKATADVTAPWLARFVPTRSNKPGVRAKIFAVEPAVYEVEFPGAARGARVTKVWGISSQGRMALGQPAEGGIDSPVASHAMPASLAKPQQLWQGQVTVSGARVESRPVVIAPGTTIWLEPEASLVFTNTVTAEGTAEQPIRFLPLNADQPWATLALAGRGASGSSFRHCQISGGSGQSGYPAMLSIVDVHGVTIEQCSIEGHSDALEVLRTVYSAIDISGTRISGHRRQLDLGIRAAALTFDLSQAILQDVQIEDHSGHGIDAMGSRVVVQSSRIKNVGGRGLLARSAAEVLAIDNLITASMIAAESRDESRLWLFNATLRGNGLGLHADQRDWRFPRGGTLRFTHSHLADERAATTSKRSSMFLTSSDLSSELESSESITILERIEQPIELPPWATKYRADIDSSRRGWSGDAP